MDKAAALVGFQAFNKGEGLAVIVEGRERAVNDFIKLVKEERPPSARVSSVRTEKYAGFLMRIGDFRDQFRVQLLAKIASDGLWGYSS